MRTPRVNSRLQFTAVFATLLLFGSSPLASAQSTKRKANYPPVLPEAKVEVYKQIGDVQLNLYVFNPSDHKPSDKRPAVVFFFGGGWKAGTPGQFHQHCKHLAERGMVAMTADYRVLSRHGTKAVACVSDAKTAVRWIRKNAARLGIDPNRVVAGGGSAGGHIAACTGTVQAFDEPSEDASISSVPNAMALFNPAVVLAPVAGRSAFDAEKAKDIASRTGVEPIKISPLHQVVARSAADVSDANAMPDMPTIIFHGKADETVPYWTVEAFSKAMQKAGVRCELRGFDGEGHGFFNFGRNDSVAYHKTIEQLDTFLESLGYLKPSDR